MSGISLNDRFPNLQGSTQDRTNDFDLYEYLQDSWGIVFLHPGDFTPVCSTELGQAAELEVDFKNRGVKLCGFSCNNAASHRRWIRNIEYVQGYRLQFPLFCDPDRTYAQQLGVLDPTNKDKRIKMGLPFFTVRGTYVIKPDKTVALMMIYPHSTGRNFDELLRVVDALKMTETSRVFTPANWKPGQDCIVDLDLTDAQAEEKHGKDGLRIVNVPSEQESIAPLDKHYWRYTKDPSLSSSSGTVATAGDDSSFDMPF